MGEDFGNREAETVKKRKQSDRTEVILHGSLWRAMLMIAVPVMEIRKDILYLFMAYFLISTKML